MRTALGGLAIERGPRAQMTLGPVKGWRIREKKFFTIFFRARNIEKIEKLGTTTGSSYSFFFILFYFILIKHF